jgi:hypothetical protein
LNQINKFHVQRAYTQFVYDARTWIEKNLLAECKNQEIGLLLPSKIELFTDISVFKFTRYQTIGLASVYDNRAWPPCNPD